MANGMKPFYKILLAKKVVKNLWAKKAGSWQQI